MVISGDGDLAAIGGNYFIHAARRNMSPQNGNVIVTQSKNVTLP